MDLTRAQAIAVGLKDSAGAVFQTPADLVFPGATAAGQDALERARSAAGAGKQAVSEKVRATGKTFGEGAAEGAGVPKMSMLGKVLLGLLALGVIGGGVYFMTRPSSGGKSEE